MAAQGYGIPRLDLRVCGPRVGFEGPADPQWRCSECSARASRCRTSCVGSHGSAHAQPRNCGHQCHCPSGQHPEATVMERWSYMAALAPSGFDGLRSDSRTLAGYKAATDQKKRGTAFAAPLVARLLRLVLLERLARRLRDGLG